MRLVDADRIIYHEIDEIGGEYEPYLGCSKSQIYSLPTIEAIPKADYEKRLKADMVAMLEELKKSIEDNVYNVSAYSECLDCDVVDYEDVNEIIIEKINALKGQQDGNE